MLGYQLRRLNSNFRRPNSNSQITTAVIPNRRLPSPQSLLNRITDNTTDHSTQEADPGLNGQSLPQGDSKLNAVTQERLA
ncbi:hypothetical protein MJO29_009857 [Puccinia striiformis f. sp. tritici]|nr:hypothetical protein MJO29_009857 [Puccinia striiformis f. sp. tritici]KAI9625593.1 hypothetical protein KEM48_010855 [Puccinia striiformis f. sp. tritici PST-130]